MAGKKLAERYAERMASTELLQLEMKRREDNHNERCKQTGARIGELQGRLSELERLEKQLEQWIAVHERI